MKKFITFASDIRLNALVCSSVAVLLTACGGDATDGLAGQQTQTAAYTYNSASTATGAPAVTATDVSAATATGAWAAPATGASAATASDASAAPATRASAVTATDASAAMAPAAGADMPAAEAADVGAPPTPTEAGAAAPAPAAGFDLSGYASQASGSEASAAGDATSQAAGQAAEAGANAPTRLLAMSVAVSASTGSQDQITQLYRSLLGRAPDAAGLAYWSQALDSGVSIETITAYIKASDEYKARQSNTGGTGTTGPAIPATTYNYYVAPTGSDNNAGTKSAPFKTLARAVKAATKASTTVWVAPGTYSGGFKTTASGTSSGRIYWVSTTRWGARIVPPSSSSNNNAWDNRGNYVSIVGFDIDGSVSGSGTKWTHGIYMGGSYGMVQNTHVHHIAKNVSCTSAGGSAINTDGYYGGVLNDVVGNVVNDIGATSCKYIQGIYISTSGKVQNNLVYRVGEAAIHLWHDAKNVTITNNTVTSSTFGIIVGGGDFYKSRTGDDYTVVNNNIVFDNQYGISEQGTTGKHNSYSNNLVYQNSTYNISLKNGLTAKNTVSSNPLFVSYSKTATTPNFHLASGSPAIGRGIATGALPTDLNGKPRNATTGYDIGAYQH